MNNVMMRFLEEAGHDDDHDKVETGDEKKL